MVSSLNRFMAGRRERAPSRRHAAPLGYELIHCQSIHDTVVQDTPPRCPKDGS